VDGLNDELGVAKSQNTMRGLQIRRNMILLHPLLVDDILIFFLYEAFEGRKLKEILDCFYDATLMLINDEKYAILFFGSCRGGMC
jgi:hypothetical protein